MPHQIDLFGASAAALPEGFAYAPDLIDREAEGALIEHIAVLPLKEYVHQGYVGKRRTMSFGLRWNLEQRVLEQVREIPDWLLPLRAQAAAFAGLDAGRLVMALATEYTPGAPIGWHRDRAVYEDIVGVSLASACTFRLRRERPDGGWDRASLVAAPRSVYLMRGPSREEWEHSIPPVDALRYSITFRSVRERR